MEQYKVNVTYTRLNRDNDTVTKVMSFVTPADSLEEAYTIVQEIAMPYINKVSGSLISVD
jgi:hypothetical protein